MSRLGFRVLVLVLAGVSGVFAACSDDDDGAGGGGGGDASPPDAASAETGNGTIDPPSEDAEPPVDDASVEDAGADAADDGDVVDGGLPLRGPLGFSTTYAHTCAVREGGVRCWGWNWQGALGVPDLGDYSATPVTVQGLNDVVEIAAGGDHTCALRSDGTIACWGSNSDGQLGQGPGGPWTSEVPIPVPDLTGMRGVCSGYRFSCATKGDRSVVCWGDNSGMKLGFDAAAGSSVPIAVPDIADVELLACGVVRACVIHTDRTVSCWGHSRAPAVVSGVTNAVSLALGESHACALRANGTVACWGSNEYGQLGRPSPTSSSSALVVPDLDDVVAIGAGYYHTCAVRSGGDVLCWGRNEHGALGTGDASAGVSITPLPVATLTDALVVAGGHHFSCARRAGERVSCWGRNNSGELGGGTDASSSPVPVEVVGF